jgi:hypothetical protein
MTIVSMKKLVNIGFCLFSFSLIMFNTSCKQGNGYPKEVATLDSLKVQLNKADSIISKADTILINKDCSHTMVSLELIKSSNKDTMSSGAAGIFSALNKVRWSFQTFLGKRNVIKSEISKSIGQITHLSHDLQNGLIKADSVSIYYNFEVKRATELIETVRFAIADINSNLPIYKIIAPQADSLISRLKNHESI